MRPYAQDDSLDGRPAGRSYATTRPMKHLLPFCLALGLLAASGCTDRDQVYDDPADEQAAETEYVSYGEPLAVGDGITALSPAALTADPLAYDGTVVRVEGTVSQVCQAKGCWLTLQNPTATPVRVQVPRDAEGAYLFTFPTDLGAREAIVEGVVLVDTTSAETLRHLAEDEGRPQAEIDAIVAPQPTIVLTARGVLVKAPAAVQS